VLALLSKPGDVEGLETCSTCARAATRARRDGKALFWIIPVSETRPKLEVGSVELEDGEPSPPPVEAAPLKLRLDDAEPAAALCLQCARGVALDGDGSNHVVGGALDVRPCRAAFNVTLEADNAGTAFARALEEARRFAKAEGVAFVVYGQGFRYLVRRESLKLNLEGAHVAQRVTPEDADNFNLCELCARGVKLSADGWNHIGTRDEDVQPCRAAFDIQVKEGGYPSAMNAALDFAGAAARIERTRFVVWEIITGQESPHTAKMRLSVRRESFNYPAELLKVAGASARIMKTAEPAPLPSVEPEETLQVAEPGDAETKKEMILKLWETDNVRDIVEIVRRVKARPSYVAQVLQKAGHLDSYFDLFQTTGREQNVYTRYFRNVLHFRNVEAARESVARIDRLYNYFERLGDRAGQHQACILALTGKNRARWSGKTEEAEIFHQWLITH
jgi:hypothetical protein